MKPIYKIHRRKAELLPDKVKCPSRGVCGLGSCLSSDVLCRTEDGHWWQALSLHLSSPLRCNSGGPFAFIIYHIFHLGFPAFSPQAWPFVNSWQWSDWQHGFQCEKVRLYWNVSLVCTQGDWESHPGEWGNVDSMAFPSAWHEDFCSEGRFPNWVVEATVICPSHFWWLKFLSEIEVVRSLIRMWA